MADRLAEKGWNKGPGNREIPNVGWEMLNVDRKLSNEGREIPNAGRKLLNVGRKLSDEGREMLNVDPGTKNG